MSQFAFCFLFLLSHSKNYKQKNPKTKQRGAQGIDLLVSQLSQSWLAGPTFPCSSCCCVGTNHSTCEHSHGSLLAFLPLSPLLSPVLYPSCLSAHWRYQKFQIFKAVSVFSVYAGDFTMVHGQKGFSTSHTQTLVHFLFLASLHFVGPSQTAALKCSVQPCHGRTPNPFQCRG